MACTEGGEKIETQSRRKGLRQRCWHGFPAFSFFNKAMLSSGDEGRDQTGQRLWISILLQDCLRILQCWGHHVQRGL